MPRQLRSRRSRPNYAALHTGEDTKVYVPDSEGLESGSEFAADDSGADGGADAQDDAEPDVEGSEGEDPGPSSKATQAKKEKPKSQGPAMRPRKSVPTGPSKPSKSTSSHHRHRPPLLFRRDAQVERLLDPPTPFHPTVTTLTNNFTSSARTAKRLERSWGRNVGPGPVHEILEDRAWFKEAIADSAAFEAGRRPVVYDTIKLDGRHRVVSERSVSWTPIPPVDVNYLAVKYPHISRIWRGLK